MRNICGKPSGAFVLRRVFFFFFPECFDKLRCEALFLYSTDTTEEFGEEGLLTQNSFYPLPKKKKRSYISQALRLASG